MSKAFTREDDELESLPALQAAPLPPGVKNYITPAGDRALRESFEALQNRRAQLAGTADRSQLASIDQKLARLTQILSSVLVAPITPSEEVRFGATVDVKYPSGDVETFRIVGVNEIDLDRNWISWQSPIARALMNAKAGQAVKWKAPAGELKLEVLSVRYEDIP
jgi:transcription elongation factor GreB